jgi:hypothetical protein
MWRAMLAILEGRYDDAERVTAEGAAIGRAADDANAETPFEVQRLDLHFQRGRVDEADLAAFERRVRTSPAEAGWRAWLADIHLLRGDEAAAGASSSGPCPRFRRSRATPTG